jgi:hypothetical protein
MATKFNQRYSPLCGCLQHRINLGLVAPYNNSCPTLCGTGFHILEISDNYSVDGWYLQVDASNLVYMESNVITQTVSCPSGIANLYLVAGENTSWGAYFTGGSWQLIAEVHFLWDSGLDYQVIIAINALITGLVGTQIQASFDGTNYDTATTFDGNDFNGILAFERENFDYRIVFNWNSCPYQFDGCPYYPPEFWQYQVPSATDFAGNWQLFAVLVTLAESAGFTFDMEGSTDGGTTWSVCAANIPYAAFDGSTNINTNVAYPTPFRTRIKITSNLGCISYSEENTNTE